MTRPASLALGAESARKAIHLGTAIVPISWALDLVTVGQLRAALGVAAIVALGIEALRFASAAVAARFDQWVGALLRPHERTSISGATWLALAMCVVVWWAPRAAAIAALWAAAVGDAAAALVGRSLQRLRAVDAPGKSFAGSAAALLATAAGVRWLTTASLPLALGLGAVAALAEWPRRPLDDNLRVALAVALAASALGLR